MIDWERRRHWDESIRDLVEERRPLITKVFEKTITPLEQILLAHIEREIDWYTYQVMKPDLDRLEKQARSAQRRAKRFSRRVIELVQLVGEEGSERANVGVAE